LGAHDDGEEGEDKQQYNPNKEVGFDVLKDVDNNCDYSSDLSDLLHHVEESDCYGKQLSNLQKANSNFFSESWHFNLIAISISFKDVHASVIQYLLQYAKLNDIEAQTH